MPQLFWQFDPVLIGSILTLGVCFGLAIGPLRSQLAPKQSFPVKEAIIFYSGLILMYLIEGSPLHDLAERFLFSAHMFQHLAMSYIVAPILLWGTPNWVLRPVLLNPIIKPVAKLFTKPLLTFAMFNILFSLWHLPVIYEGALANSSLHHTEHLIFLFSSLLFWWPLMSKLPELPRLHYGGQLIYLFVTPIAQLPVFATITFSEKMLYPSYANAVRVWFNEPLMDQALGGVIMKVVGLVVFGLPFIFIFFRWFASEHQHPKDTKASQQNVQGKLENISN